MIGLGSKVRDKVTGFEGIAIAKVEYLNGCIQYCIKPRAQEDGKMPVGEYIDISQLLEITEDVVVTGMEPSGGLMPDTPNANYSG